MRSAFFVSVLVMLLVSGSAAPTGPERVIAQDAPKDGLDVAEFTLDNGLKVLVVNRPGVPVVSSYVWYKVGSMDERRGITGMAHFLEHMMFKGSKDYKVGQVDDVTVRNGGSNNAFTSNDYTAYFINLPKSRFEEGLKIEADRMRHLTLDLAEFVSEKKVVQSESDISADDPNDQLWERISQALHGAGHPYSHPVLGWPQDVQDMTRRDMRLFYDAHYHPNHATLVLVGDITEEQAKPVVTRLFGPLPRGPELKRPTASEVSLAGPVTLEVKSESAIIEMGRQYLTQPAGHADEAALNLLASILGGGVTSRLYRALVDEQGVATGIAAWHQEGILAGNLGMWASLAPERTREELGDGIRATVDHLIKEGLPEAELERARNKLLASLLFQQESASSIASMLGAAETVNGDWQYALSMPERIRAVTAEDVIRVAGKYLRPEQSVTGWLVPELSPPARGATVKDAAPQPLPVQKHVLPNGLTVLLMERSGLPLLTVTADIRTGRASETPEQAGFSQFTGTLLDAGTRSWTKQELAEAIESIGGQLSVGASGVTVRALSEHRGVAMKALAECMLAPTFPEKEIALLRDQTLTDIESSKNETQWFARAAAAAAVYGPDNPLGRPSQGTEESLSGFTREQVVNWHRRWFRPDNCVIAAVGDFKANGMLQQITAAFGDWRKPADPLQFPKYKFARDVELKGTQVIRFSEFEADKVNPLSKRVAVDHPGKDQVVVRLQTLGITRDNPDYLALRVMDSILGTSPGFTDRFSKVLRDQMGLAYSAGSNISSSAGQYPGAFVGYIGTRPENVELAIKTMYKLIDEIRTVPVSADELAMAKDYLKGSFVFDLETTGQLAELLVSIERYDLGFDYLVKFTHGVDAVSAEDVQRVASKYLVPERMVEVLSGPIQKITPLPETPEEE